MRGNDDNFSIYLYCVTFQTVFRNQYLVRPEGQPAAKENHYKKDNKTNNATETSAATSVDAPQPTIPEFSFPEDVLQKVGKPLKEVIEMVKIKSHSIL